MLAPDSLDFSYSGLKTALLYRVRGQDARRGESPLRPGVRVADAAAGFQEAVVDVLVAKTLRAVERTGVGHVVLGGGVAANALLRERMDAEARRRGVGLTLPSKPLCTDNAAMVALVGARRLRSGERDDLRLDARSRMNG
jgi:N6-L-threonylcarbamoyladenine synthase